MKNTSGTQLVVSIGDIPNTSNHRVAKFIGCNNVIENIEKEKSHLISSFTKEDISEILKYYNLSEYLSVSDVAKILDVPYFEIIRQCNSRELIAIPPDCSLKNENGSWQIQTAQLFKYPDFNTFLEQWKQDGIVNNPEIIMEKLRTTILEYNKYIETEPFNPEFFPRLSKRYNLPTYLGVSVVAGILAVTPETVRKYCREGKIKAVKCNAGRNKPKIKIYTNQFFEEPSLRKVVLNNLIYRQIY